MPDTPTPPEDLRPTETAEPAGPSQPDRIGPYRLLQKLGEGGMGEVWLAEQTEPIRRRVALKVIKQGMDTKQVIARFEAERQALAMMDHPNVAKVFDAGATPTGRPYFVMEHVPGVPITEHCDRQRLPTRERLELFRQVCEGVQHAHQKAIIHRDIKPSNVLVALQDGNPVPKIIDFGVAKATARRLTERTVFTELGVLIGTPEYMSPEQAEMTGQDVDTRTDVYSLGVLLYELLTGALPFDPKELRKGGFDEIRRRIREEEPSKPSTKISTLGEAATGSAKNRRTDPAALQKQLSGDLDWITMKALEKNRTRRYGTPSELAAEVVRHLTGRPVFASPPSVAYSTGKFVRRHRFGVAVAATAALTLIAFVITTTTLLTRATVERRRAELAKEEARREAETAKRVTEILAEIFDVASPEHSRGDDVTVREVFDYGARIVKSQLVDSPEVQARLLDTIGRVYMSLGAYGAAEDHLRAALDIREHSSEYSAPRVAESLQHVAELLVWVNRRPDALPLAERALAIRESSSSTTATELAESLRILSMSVSAIEQSRKIGALERARDLLDGSDETDPLVLARVLFDLGLVMSGSRLEVAEDALTRALALREEHLPEYHPDTAAGLHRLGALYKGSGRTEDAAPLLERAMIIRREVLDEHHPLLGQSIHHLAEVRDLQGQYSEAEALYEEAYAIRMRSLPAGHEAVIQSLKRLVMLRKRLGRYGEAEAILRSHLTNPQLPAHVRVFLATKIEIVCALDGRCELGGPAYGAMTSFLRQNAPQAPEATVAYNQACYWSIAGRPDRALALLRQAVDLGWPNLSYIGIDPDLEPLRTEPGFQTLLSEIQPPDGMVP